MASVIGHHPSVEEYIALLTSSCRPITHNKQRATSGLLPIPRTESEEEGNDR